MSDRSRVERSIARRRRATWSVSVVVLLSLVAAACGVQEEAEFAGAPEGPVLTGEFETLDGNTIDLASLQGQDVVLWFWAPW